MTDTSLLILAATSAEIGELQTGLDLAQSKFAHRQLAEGEADGRPIAILEAGIGCVNTAQALTAYLESRPVETVLQIGIGGAYRTSGLGIGDLAVATSEAYGDAGVVTPEGWKPLDEIGIPLYSRGGDVFNVIPVDTARASTAATALADAMPGVGVVAGPFVTVQQCSGGGDLGDAIAERFSGICESMEGAAAAHVCALYGVPFVEVRAISNLVEDRDTSKWNIPGACRVVQEAAVPLIEVLTTPGQNSVS